MHSERFAAVGEAAAYVSHEIKNPLMVIGGLAAPISYFAIRLRQRRNLDESLDVWACHGMASTWGMIAAGLFATVTVNSSGANGLFLGNPNQLGIQALAVVVTIVFSFGSTQAQRHHAFQTKRWCWRALAGAAQMRVIVTDTDGNDRNAERDRYHRMTAFMDRCAFS